MPREGGDGLSRPGAKAQHCPCWDLLSREALAVGLAHNPDAPSRFVTVSVENQRAVYQASRHLLALGHQRIGMIAGPVQQSDRASLRYQGYCQAMEEAGHSPLPLIEMPHHTRADIDVLLPWIAAPSSLTALLCSNDLLAISTIGNLQRRGFNVPQQVSVVGFDGIQLGEMLCPSLCTIEQPQQALGEAALTSLLALISGEASPCRTLDFTLRHGESVARAQIL